MKNSVTIHKWFLNLKLQVSLRLPWDIFLIMFNQFPVFRIPVSHWLYCSWALSRRSLCKKGVGGGSAWEARPLLMQRHVHRSENIRYTENVFCLRTTLRQPNSPAKFAVWKGDHYSTSPSVFCIRKLMQLRQKPSLQQVARTANSAPIQQGATRQTSFLSLMLGKWSSSPDYEYCLSYSGDKLDRNA